MGLPSFALAVSPRSSEILASLSALASAASSLCSGACAQPVGIAKHHTTRNASAIVIFVMACLRGLLRLLLQHRVDALEQGHAALQQLVIVRNRLDEAVDREVDARGFVAGELAVVQVGLVDDLADHPHPVVFDAEP